MRARLYADVRIWLLAVVLSAAGGSLYGAILGDEPFDWAQGAVVGAAIGGWCAAFDLFALRSAPARRLRELPFLLHLAVKTGWYAVGMVAFIYLGEIAFDDDPRRANFGRTLAFSFAAALVFHFFLMLTRMLGQNVLGAFVTGRYHRPREEERVFLFADLVGSTAAAERLGNARFHRLLNDVIMDLTEPALEARGEIHAYVGDEVIVTWPLARGVQDAACVRCCFAIADRLATRRETYLRAYGMEPRLRMALHCGPVIAGEMGDMKRQIAFLGDAVNATARLEQACRELGRDLLISGDLLGRLRLPDDVAVESLGPIALRGRAGATEVAALARRAA